MTSPLVIYGIGGFAREVFGLVEDINAVRPTWDVLGFLDDNPDSWGESVGGLPVLGGADWLARADNSPNVVLGIGSPAVKHRLSKALRGRCGGFPTLVHPTVVMSKRVELGEGCIITAGNVLTTEIRLGVFVTVNLLCTIGHDCDVGDCVTISPGVNVSGNVRLGEGCDVGTGSAIVQGVTIGEWTVIGAGAVVARDLPSNCTAIGVPAKPVKVRDPGWHQQ